MAVGSAKQTQGFADVFGGRNFNVIDYTGVSSYANTGTPSTSGEALDPKFFGFQNTIQFVAASGDQSGTYYGIVFPVNNGVTAWRIRWFAVATGQEVTNGTNLSTRVLKLSGIGF